MLEQSMNSLLWSIKSQYWWIHFPGCALHQHLYFSINSSSSLAWRTTVFAEEQVPSFGIARKKGQCNIIMKWSYATYIPQTIATYNCYVYPPNNWRPTSLSNCSFMPCNKVSTCRIGVFRFWNEKQMPKDGRFGLQKDQIFGQVWM